MFEIKQVKVTDEDHDRVALASFKKRGIRMLDGGAYATVFSAPKSNTVFKLGKDGDPYFNFVKELAKLERHNPYLPRIHKVTVFKLSASDFSYVVEMERLDPWRRGTHYLDPYFLDSNIYKNEERFKSAWREEFGGTPSRHLLRAIDLIKRAKKRYGSGADYDFHGDNVMMRGNQFVITDPLG
jgi:hypothetical protein